jgi:hypothetical protein
MCNVDLGIMVVTDQESGNRPHPLANMGVFDFTPLASLADEPGCGQPEPASNHASLMFDLFSHLRQAKTSICV